ncbi:DUF6777 domain-containing protein [Streptomyces sp. NPDC059443]|uniref:DUF6777 domain-containing protein n=1 Tax=unclassified Streptomyces TaxID=2593676 RepID=UPI003687F627
MSGGREGLPPPPPPAPPGSGGGPGGPGGVGGPGGPGGSSGASAGPPPKPWWRSLPRLATAMVALAAAVTLAVVLTRPTGGGTGTSAGGEVFLQPAAASGPDPFTESTAAEQATPPPESTPAESGLPPSEAPATGATVTRSVSGSSPGLYGGSKDVASCDVEKQIKVLSGQPAKNAAFASALGLQPSAVPGYLRSLTAVQLRMDTRVTNHGYRDGKATAYQAVLQAGTAVLVDDRGVPRVRCACGNPLGSPVALRADPKHSGQPWTSYRPAQVVVIAPSVTIVNTIVIYDHHDRRWYERDRGDNRGKHDKLIPPPVLPTLPPVTSPPVTSPPVTSPPPSSQSPSASVSPSPSASVSESASESPPVSPSASESASGYASESPSESASQSPSAYESQAVAESSSAPPSSSPPAAPCPSPSGSVTPPPEPGAPTGSCPPMSDVPAVPVVP